MIFTIAFISIPNTNSAKINMCTGPGSNTIEDNTGRKEESGIKGIVFDNKAKVNEWIRSGLVTEKATSLIKDYQGTVYLLKT
jgi:hypothetical protein